MNYYKRMTSKKNVTTTEWEQRRWKNGISVWEYYISNQYSDSLAFPVTGTAERKKISIFSSFLYFCDDSSYTTPQNSRQVSSSHPFLQHLSEKSKEKRTIIIHIFSFPLFASDIHVISEKMRNMKIAIKVHFLRSFSSFCLCKRSKK